MNRRRAEAPKTIPVLVDATQKAQPSKADRQRDTAEYLADMILELRNLARSFELHTIMVPLEFAYYEAFGFAHKVEVPPGEVERIRALSKSAESLDRNPGNIGI
ncbi:MAG: hypothetical protein NTZ54_19020 [Alphaproteobacteria bacterium]|uniref:hypothetical protein n=1 Tax=Aestuariivirga sp. TaxID=2650926 RepID=UPI00301629F1|nr:hypothetical protein [Alphaproteobacteria bacterium]